MKREKQVDSKEEKRKIFGVVGFLISITLLSIAIIISMNKESNTAKIATKNNTNNHITAEASKALSKDINTVKSVENNINQTNENNLNTNTSNENSSKETNEIKSSDNKTEENNEESKKNSKESETKNADNNTEESFIMPVEGKIIQQFSMDSLIYSETLQEWTTHRGIDIEAEKATTVKVIRDGTVKSIKQDPRYGLSVIVEHDKGFESVYSGLLSSEFVKEGDKLKQGDSIGTVGNSSVFESLEGSHLHLELLKDGEYVNPELYIK